MGTSIYVAPRIIIANAGRCAVHTNDRRRCSCPAQSDHPAMADRRAEDEHALRELADWLNMDADKLAAALKPCNFSKHRRMWQ